MANPNTKNKPQNDEVKNARSADDLFLNLHITEDELNVYSKDVEIKKLQPGDNKKKKKKFKMLTAFSILFIILAVIIVISWILWGTKQTAIVDGKTVRVEAIGIIDLFYLPFRGFAKQASIIVFVLTIGAFINIVVLSKSLEGFSETVTKKLKGKEVYAIIPLMIFFSICGSVEGLAEESLGFYMICIPLMLAIGFDVFTGFLIVFLGAGMGVLASTVNPFLINTASAAINDNIADGIDKFDLSDGLVWRLITLVVMTTFGISVVMFRAKKIKKNPQKSVTFSTYEGDKEFFLGTENEKVNMDWRKHLTLIIFMLAFLVMIFYLVDWDSIMGYVDNQDLDTYNPGPFAKLQETLSTKAPYFAFLVPRVGDGDMLAAAGFFLIAALVLGVVNGLGEAKFLSQFMAGAADILSVCLVIGVAAGISIALDESHIQGIFNTALKDSVGSLDPLVKPLLLFFIFLPIAFLIPSTSGFAFSIFPMISGSLMAKHGGSLDPVAASGSIQAFSFASGFLNLFTPTSGVVMGAIAIARMDYGQFLKGMWKILLAVFVLCIIMLLLGGAIASTSWGAQIA